MKRFAVCLLLALVMLSFAVPAHALNPQSQGHGRKAVPGGTKTIVTFGPVATQGALPTGYVMHSGDESAWWYNTYYMNGTTAAMEAVPVKVPSATTIVAPDVIYSGGSMYHYFFVNATNVAATDSVYIDPMFGGLGK